MSTACNDYKRGLCFRANCRYAHDGPPPVANYSAAAQACRDYQSGRCTRGNRCRFTHDGLPGTPAGSYQLMPGLGVQSYTPPEIIATAAQMYAENPYAAAAAVASAYNPQQMLAQQQVAYMQSPYLALVPSDICRDFQKGVCTRGVACRYSHGTGGQGEVKQQCGDYLAGSCTRGDQCRYSHQGAADVCRDFQKGTCDRPNCRYLHDPSQQAPGTEVTPAAASVPPPPPPPREAPESTDTAAAATETAQAEQTETPTTEATETKKREREEEEATGEATETPEPATKVSKTE